MIDLEKLAKEIYHEWNYADLNEEKRFIMASDWEKLEVRIRAALQSVRDENLRAQLPPAEQIESISEFASTPEAAQAFKFAYNFIRDNLKPAKIKWPSEENFTREFGRRGELENSRTEFAWDAYDWLRAFVEECE